MKTIILMMIGLVAATSAGAQSGFDLRWDACATSGGTITKSIDCSSPAAMDILIGSAVTGVSIPNWRGHFQATLDVVSDSGPIPDWWTFRGEGANEGCQIGWTTDFTGPPGCTLLFGGGQSIHLFSNGSHWNGDPSTNRYVLAGTMDASTNIDGATEYALFQFTIYHANPNNCIGCCTPEVHVAIREMVFYNCDGSVAATLSNVIPGRADSAVAVTTCGHAIDIDTQVGDPTGFRIDGSTTCLGEGGVGTVYLPEGTHSVLPCNAPCGTTGGIDFNVESDGTVSYDPGLEPAVQGAGTTTLTINAFPGTRGDDIEPSIGLFRVVIRPMLWDLVASYPGYGVVDGVHRLLSGILYDPATVIGRSDILPEEGAADGTGVPVGSAGTLVADSDMPFKPTAFESGPGTLEIHTEVRSLHLVDGSGVEVRAGTNAPDRPISAGEVEQLPGSMGFLPGHSYFDVFAEVDLPLFGGNPGVTTLYTASPLVVENDSLTCFPPKIVYLHRHTGPARLVFKYDDIQVPRRWHANELFGWLVLAGHGYMFDTLTTVEPAGRAETENVSASGDVDAFRQVVEAEPEMADTATLSVDLLDIVSSADPSAYTAPEYQDSLLAVLDATAQVAGDPCQAVSELVYGLLVRVDGLADPEDWVQDPVIQTILYEKTSALATEYQQVANEGGGCLPTAVAADAVPSRVAIQHVHPNPTGGSTSIRYGIPRFGRVSLAIFDVGGRRVRTLVNGNVAAGAHFASWDGRFDDGSVAPSGIYFARLRAAGGDDVKRITLAR